MTMSHTTKDSAKNPYKIFAFTLLFSVLAMAGNYFKLPIFFGVDIIFGSIAVLSAAVTLGIIPGMIAALAGGIVTIFLWGHPFALIVFTLEALFIGLLWRRLPYLALLDAIFWVILGIPMVVFFYSIPLKMDWSAVTMIALKQPLNGIFNAVFADLFILSFSKLYGTKIQKSLKKSQFSLSRLLFNAVLTVVLMAGTIPILLDISKSRSNLEFQLEKELKIVYKQILHKFQQNNSLPAALLDGTYLDENTGIALISASNTIIEKKGILRSLKEKGSFETTSGKLRLWLPETTQPQLLQWRNGQYILVENFPGDGNRIHTIHLEYKSKPIILQLERQRFLTLGLLLLMTIIAILTAYFLSIWITRPILELNKLSLKLSEKITYDKTIILPKSSIFEFQTLSDSMGKMYDSLVKNFSTLSQLKNSLELQVQERTRELENRESLFREITESQTEFIHRFDPDFTTTYVNPAMADLFGVRSEEMLGKNWTYGLPEPYRQSVIKPFQEITPKNPLRIIENAVTAYDGSKRWISWQNRGFFNKDGTLHHYQSVGQDITEQKIANTSLIEKEKSLSLALAASHAGFYILDLEKGRANWDDRCYEIYGRSKETFDASLENVTGSVIPEDKEMLERFGKLLESTATDWHEVYRVFGDDNKIHYVEGFGFIVRKEDNTPVKVIGTVIDITERKIFEKEILNAKEEAEKASLAKSQFLSSMSHELRTPLNAILGFSQLIQSDPELKEKHKDYTKEIVSGGEHLLGLINEVLDLSRIETGKIDLSLESVELKEVLEECLTLIKPLADKRNIKIVKNDFNNLVVFADRIRLKQIMINLLSNAVKYNEPSGKITVQTQRLDTNEIQISIQDTGSGISKENMNNLFLPFNRFSHQGGEIEGTGIGLAISKKIVELMNGNIGAESRLNEGSTFWFKLPEGKINDAYEAHKKSITSNYSKVEGKHKTILYIEDNPSNLKLVTHLISQRPNCTLLTAHTPGLGLDLAEVHNPDLILLDITMPEMDGYTVLKKIRESTLGKNLPVIAITANAMPHDVKRGMEAGFNDYLTKPLNVKLFFETIDKYILS